MRLCGVSSQALLDAAFFVAYREYCPIAPPRFPVKFGGVDELHAAFLGESRTCGHRMAKRAWKSGKYDVFMSLTTPVAPEVLDRARKIKLFLMDVDGTLTDGSVNLISLPDDGGVAEMKAFNSQDGAGLKLAHIMGIRTGFITGRKSPAVTQRAQELKVEFVYLGQETKMAAFDECLQKAGVQAKTKWPTWATTCPICRWPSAPGWQLPWPTRLRS